MSTIPDLIRTKISPRPPLIVKTKDELRKMYEEQDQARESLKEKLGVISVAVELIREGREEE